MPRLVWLILTVGLFCFGTYALIFAIYLVSIVNVGYNIGFIHGTFIFPLLIYYATYKSYKSWKKARGTDKQTEKKK